MKKTLRNILLLTLWMVLCLVPIQANAEGENPIELTQDNYKSYLKDSAKYDKYYLPSNSYILMEDITLDDTLLIGFAQQYYNNDFTGLAVTLDLNGYVLRQGNVQELVPVIQVYQGSTLTIQDSRPEEPHKFTADSTGLWKLDEENGDKTVYGGVITGSVKTGLVLQAMDSNHSNFIAQCTMNGGNIVGCTYNSYGGGVNVGEKAEFTMNGGSIRGCTVTDPQYGYGGGVFVVAGTFSMNGGTISDCVSATTDGGNALYVTDDENNDLRSNVSMSSEATINGSFKNDTSGAASIYTVTFDSDGGTAVPPQVRPENATVVKPDDPTKDGYAFDGWYNGDTVYDFTQPVTADLTLTAKWKQHIHCVCGENGNHTNVGDHTAHTDEVWTAWTATDKLPETAGNYYLVNDVDITAGSTDWHVDKKIKLCLNGKKITMNGAAITVEMGELSLTDCVGGGRIIGGSGAASAVDSVVNLNNYAILNLYGGSISNSNPSNPGNSVVCFRYGMEEAAFNMYGGTLGDPDGAVGGDSDGVYIKFAEEAKNGNIFNAYGGKVRGVISTTIDQENYNEVGKINFAGTVFESKVYLKKGNTDAPKQSELSGKGEIVYFYPIKISNGTEYVRIDEQNKGDVFGDGSVSFEYDENGGGGSLTLEDAKLSNIVTQNTTPFELRIALKGNNKITTGHQAVFTNNLTFSGNGRLAIETEQEGIVCNEMLVESGDISIFTQSGLALARGNQKLKVNGGTLELATANPKPGYGVLYTDNSGGTVDIALGADRKMIKGNNSDGTDAVITEATDKAAIGAAKYVYIGEKHDHCLCGGNINVGDHTTHDDVTWIPWTAKDKLPETAGNYYLVNDVVIPADNSEWEVVGLNLCLNGKKVTTNGAAITIGYNYNGDDCFSLTDCAGGGKIIGGASTAGGGSCVVRLEMSETFNLFGGSISSISPKNENNSIVCYDNSANCTFNMYGGTLGDPDDAAGEDSDGIYVRFYGTSDRGNIFNAYGGSVRGVISKTVDHVSYDEIGIINFGGTVFESKVYLSKGSTNIPEENELSGEGKIVYFYPIKISNGTEWVRIDEQNKDDILGDGGKVKFEYMESTGSGRLTLKDAELADDRKGYAPIWAGLDLEIDLLGDNKITGDCGIYTEHKLIISGTGKLTTKVNDFSHGIRCDEMTVNSGDISISTEKYGAIFATSGKLTVNGGTLDLAVSNTDPTYGVLYTKIGEDIDADKVINITLGADRSMLAGKNSDGTDAVLIEPTDKNAVGNAKYIYIGEKHDHCLCGGKAYDGHDSHTDISWIPWMAADKLPDKAGNYYLVNDVTLPAGTAALPDGVNLCLNGKAVKGVGAGYTKLSINGAMTVTDCGKAGSFGDLTISDGAFTMTGNARNEGELRIDGRTDFTMTGNARNNGLIKLNETNEDAKIVFGGSCGGSGTVKVSSPQYAAGIRAEGSAKLAALEGETLGIYIRLTMKEKAKITVDILGFRALSMSGESIIHGKVTGADASSSFTMEDNATIDGDIEVGDSKVDGKVICTGNIISGTFNDDVVCSGEIQEGIFHGNVENNGKIIGGTFHGNVKNNGTITGGIFYGTVSGNGTIEDSAKVTVSFHSDGGSAVDAQKILRGQKAAAPQSPARVGYIFDRWAEGGTAFDFAAPVIRDTTLTAMWTLCDHSASTAQATCTKQATCTVCKEKYGNVLGHSYGEPTYTWNGTSCTAERVCGRDASHKETETVTAVVTVTQQPTCTQGELSAYTATFTNAAFAVQRKENIKTGEELGHSYGEPSYTWNGRSCRAERICGHDASHRETEIVTAAATVTQNRTCTLDELSTYTAAFANTAFAVQKKENVMTADRLGHNFKVQQSNETQHWSICSRCNELSAKENHTGGTAACSAKAECAVCHAKYGEIDPNNHSGLEKVAGIPATAAETGNMEYWRCNDCGKLFSDAAGKNEIALSDTTLWKLAPAIIEGMNGKWNKGREDGLTFKSDAAYADFIGVLVDGTAISADNYTAHQGSIIVELKADYLASLTEGEHTIAIRSASGDAVTKFTVDAMIHAPKTGPEDTGTWKIAMAAVLGIFSVTTVVFAVYKRKTTETD